MATLLTYIKSVMTEAENMQSAWVERSPVCVICITCVSNNKICTSAPWWANMSGNPSVQDVRAHVTFSMLWPQQNALLHTLWLLIFTPAQCNQCLIRHLSWNTWMLDGQTAPGPVAECYTCLRENWVDKVEGGDKSNLVWTHEISQWLTAYEYLTDSHFSQSKGQRKHQNTERKCLNHPFNHIPFLHLVTFS